jgi:hypothetical protein
MESERVLALIRFEEMYIISKEHKNINNTQQTT